MGRPQRGQSSSYAYHVLNRGNGNATVFHKEEDYRAFLDLLAAAKSKFTVSVFAFCLMPNHFHIIVQPRVDEGLSLFMQWWQTNYARHHHHHYRSHGHLWQGRFRSFPIQEDDHFLSVLRYVLHNPVRAHLVSRPEWWPWSSIQHRALVDPWPVEQPPDWVWRLGTPLGGDELTCIRRCVNRQAPFGTADWQVRTANILQLTSTLRPPGRPPKSLSETGD
jgi:putative transposase